MKNFENSIFRFRQDLRIFDNLGLQRAIENSKTVTPLFIFDEAILAKSLKKDPRLGFLIEAV
ncbi:MAG TPA: deoxyribodipyrimidine photo-lyase, partial [Candidatus Absconditabacterales bacterium]|nr:deoxyribodipyrimidine photo-lyase [Candidatus Absconditabacterales bacterium]